MESPWKASSGEPINRDINKSIFLLDPVKKSSTSTTFKAEFGLGNLIVFQLEPKMIIEYNLFFQVCRLVHICKSHRYHMLNIPRHLPINCK